MSAKDNEKQQLEESVQKPGELYFLLILFAIFSVFLYQSLKDKGLLEGEIGGSGTIPQLFTGAALIMIALLFIQFVKKNYKEGKILEVIKFLFSRDLIIIILLVVLYALLLESLHFILTTTLFLFFSMMFLERKKVANKLIISMATVAAIVLIFRYIFQVILP